MVYKLALVSVGKEFADHDARVAIGDAAQLAAERGLFRSSLRVAGLKVMGFQYSDSPVLDRSTS